MHVERLYINVLLRTTLPFQEQKGSLHKNEELSRKIIRRVTVYFERSASVVFSTNTENDSEKHNYIAFQNILHCKLPTMSNNTKQIELEEVADIIEVMKMQESSSTYARVCIDDDLVGLWRKMLIDWMYYVVDYCNLQRQSVAAASFFFDVAIQNKLVKTPEEHQLAAATALQLSLKTHDSSVIKLDRLVKLGRGLFTEDDVVRMEKQILEKTNWRLHPPTMYCFLRQFEQLLPTTVSETTRSMINEVTSLAVEVTLSDYNYLCYKPSEVAFAAVLSAIEMIPRDDFPVIQRQSFLLRMAAIADMNSESMSTLHIVHDIGDSLDSSPKLEKLIASMAKQRKKEKEMRTMSSETKGKSIKQFNQSPRQVMIRLMSG
jgi:hypothetical protein